MKPMEFFNWERETFSKKKHFKTPKKGLKVDIYLNFEAFFSILNAFSEKWS